MTTEHRYLNLAKTAEHGVPDSIFLPASPRVGLARRAGSDAALDGSYSGRSAASLAGGLR